MKVLYFGTYERGYPRNAQVISCLRGAGVLVDERHEPVWEDGRRNWAVGAAAAVKVARAQARLLRRPRGGYDAIIVGYPGHVDVAAARRVAAGAPVVFNPLVSLADTLVSDRRRFAPGSPPARALAALDRRALREADLVVADTAAHAEFLSDVGGIPRSRVATCFVGAEERIFAPPWRPESPPTCLFVGKLIPLHGLETVLEAARRAPHLRIRVVGSGQLDALLERRPGNVEWVRWVEYERLGDEFRRAACALGIFGTSDKAARVIPNKAFQALACATPLVTADTPAARELLAHAESALLVPRADPNALAEALTRVTADPALARSLSERGHAAYRTHASEGVLGRRWRTLLEGLL